MRPQPACVLFLVFVASFMLGGCDAEPTTPEGGELGVVSSALVADDCAVGSAGGKVTICHATGSTSNPYELISISTKACEKAHVKHSGDVLPDANGACCDLGARDCADVCGGSAVVDCAGTCGGTAVVDCAGTCGGTAALDCAGVCDGPAVLGSGGGCCEPSALDCAGVCDGSAVLDCAGVCDGSAVLDCAGVCEGAALQDDIVHFTTDAGVWRWSSASPASLPTQISTFPSYALAVSASGEVVVGTGGIEATNQGLGAAGIYAIDGAGAATLISGTAAEDLQFAPNGDLYAANASGIYEIDGTSGAAAQVSTNPTSQFAFESGTSVVTTSGSAHAGAFSWRTDRIDLVSDTSTLLTTQGGEDIHVLGGGEILVCGQGGLFELLPGGGLVSLGVGLAVFNFGATEAGNLYIGNSATYGGLPWPQGVYERPDGAPAVSAIDASHDVNALVVTDGGCCQASERDCAGICNGTAALDCAGVCNGGAVVDCAGICDGASVLDCAGVCDGTAVAGSAGGCCQPSVLDCAGVCDGDAVVDCEGVCDGGKVEADIVYFTTNAGVWRWSSAAAAAPIQVSTFASYAIAVSDAGEIVVGTGGLEATTQGMGAAGIYAIDASGFATLLSGITAEDLQFAPNGDLYAANASGIFEIDAGTGAATQVSTNPTSQFAFESDTSVVTTSGSEYAGIFSWRTDRIDLVSDTTTNLSGDGGEDIHVLAAGEILVCGQGGLFELLPSGAFSSLGAGMKVFNFAVSDAGNLYIGNSASYGGSGWPQGVYERPDGAPAVSSIDLTQDVNALVVTGGCE